MSLYIEYLEEIEQRRSQELDPKPIDGAELLSEIILQIKDSNHEYRKDSLDFFIYNVLPGTTTAAVVKSKFLKEIILGESIVEEIPADFAFEQLSHMKGGSSVEALLDIALGTNISKAKQAAKVLKTQVFLYEADTSRLENGFKAGNSIAIEIIESYAKAEFFTKLPDLPEEIKLVTFVAGIGDISTDLLSPGVMLIQDLIDNCMDNVCLNTIKNNKKNY